MKTHERTLTRIKYGGWLICVMALWMSATALADETTDSPFKNSLQPGSWSLQFRIVDDFQLSYFDGLSISCKRHYSDKSAIRVGFGLSGATRDEDSENRDPYEDRLSSIGRDANSFSFDLSALYLYYPSPTKRVNLFFGIGPDIGYSRSKDEREYQSCHDTTCSSSWRSSSSYAISADAKGVLGVEWFASENISFLAEYACTIGYRYGFAETETEQREPLRTATSESTNSRFLLGYSQVRFGLSVYF